MRFFCCRHVSNSNRVTGASSCLGCANHGLQWPTTSSPLSLSCANHRSGPCRQTIHTTPSLSRAKRNDVPHQQISGSIPTHSRANHHHESPTPLNAFITREPIHPPTTGPLSNLTVTLKDNISTPSPTTTTCASPVLSTYTSPFPATVTTHLLRAGATITGKTNMDEFGMGSHSTHTQHGAVVQPDGRSAGGSSGGSAVAVAQGWCDAALGTDTGGSVRLPAAWTAVFGFKPSYGRVSRRGVVAYANSLDTVGFLAKDVRVLRRLFEVTDIHDPEDPTSLSLGTRARLGRTTGETGRRLRIGVPTSFNIHELDPTIRHAWTESLKALHAEGHTLHAITLPSVRAALSAYYVLAPAEASSNLAKYDGVRYGGAPQTSGNATSPPSAHDQTPPPETNTQQPLFTHHRTTLFGPEVRRRILLGTYTLSADAKDNYFIQAQRVRRTVVQEFDAALRVRNPLTTFPSSSSTSSDLEVDNTGAQAKEEEEEEQGVDAILCPTAPTPPPHLDELLATSGHDDEGEEIEKSPADAYVNDVFTVPASLAGLPAVSVPVAGEKIEDKGVGMQIITQLGEDEMALKLAEELGGLMR